MNKAITAQARKVLKQTKFRNRHLVIITAVPNLFFLYIKQLAACHGLFHNSSASQNLGFASPDAGFGLMSNTSAKCPMDI